MIVPSRTLLWLWVVIGVPVCTAGILGIGAAWWSLLLIAVMGAIAAWDAYLGSSVLHQIPVSTEENVNLMRGRSAELSFKISIAAPGK